MKRMQGEVLPAAIAVLGAGNMGSALAHVLAGAGNEVRLWDHFPEVIREIRSSGENRRYLPGVRLHPGVLARESAADCVAGAGLVVLCVPSPHLEAALLPLLAALEPGAILLNAAKGFAPDGGTLIPHHLARLAPGHPCVLLAGPAIANELVRGGPVSVVLASARLSAAAEVAGRVAGADFLPQLTEDVTGAALGGILKNVYAILLGCLDRLLPQPTPRNLEAALVTAAVAEMTTIATAHGAEAVTIHGLAGLGDLLATGFSPESHNRRFGQALAAGTTPDRFLAQHGWLPEGVRAAGSACELAAAAGVAAPLARWVLTTLRGTPPTAAGIRAALREAAGS